MPQYVVPATAVYQDIATGARRRFTEGQVLNAERAVQFGMPGAVAEGIVATAAGDGQGAVPGAGSYAVTSDDAARIVTLPAPRPGTVVALQNGATGYELRTSDPATVAINGGTGANAESAIPADTFVVCVSPTADNWLCSNTAADGTGEPTEAAAP